MRYYVKIGDRTLEVDLDAGRVQVDGRTVEVDLRSIDGSDTHSLLLDGASRRVLAEHAGDGRWRLHLGSRRIDAEVVDERTRTIREMTGAVAGPVGPRPLRAPMPGLVVRMEVEAGDVVEVGQGLAIVEAMKMENELRADAPARVREVHVAPGDAVDKEQVLIDFEPVET